jgi:hypothetical protein
LTCDPGMIKKSVYGDPGKMVNKFRAKSFWAPGPCAIYLPIVEADQVKKILGTGDRGDATARGAGATVATPLLRSLLLLAPDSLQRCRDPGLAGGRLTTRMAEQQLREILDRNTFTDARGYSEALRDD